MATIPTRERILYASAERFRRRGYSGTGLKEIVRAADAPFGSLYHHFPGGKHQLAEEVLRTGGAFFLALYEQNADAAPDFQPGLRAFFAGAAETLIVTDFEDACPIATVAGETASTDEQLRIVCAEVFETWITAVSRRFEQAGGAPVDARRIAIALLSLLEGAFLLSRTQRSIDPLTAASDAAIQLVAAHLTVAGSELH